MTTTFLPTTTQLLSAKNATALVPYTRGYIARIAREGKVIGVQIDRQWHVEPTSLKNFYDQSLIEESVRKRHLSQKRKLDLEIKSHHHARLEHLAQKRLVGPVVTAVLATLVVVGGMSSGLWFLSGPTAAQLASLASYGAENYQPEAVPVPTVAAWSLAEESVVTESTRPLSRAGGIVLLPDTNSNQVAVAVADLFSDVVRIEMTGASTGTLVSSQNGTTVTLPFVRIPESSSPTGNFASP